jgi:photosystem II stability/assembly factor-like uncharacterized protein
LLLIERGDDGRASARALGLPATGGFRAPLVVDCLNPRRLFAGTLRAGVFRSDDGGETWREINHGIVYKDIWSLVQHPKTGTLYAGTSPAGVFRSDDAGDSWQACETLWQLPSTRQWHGPVAPFISRMKDLCVSDASPDLVMGAIEEGWLVRSQDGGATWEQLDEGVPHDSHTIRYVPGNADTLVLGTNAGWLRSDNAGSTWAEANAGLAARRYTPAPLVTRASQPGVLFSSVTGVGPGGWSKPGGGDSAFCRSDDGGRSWRTLTAGLPQPMAPIPRAIAINSCKPNGYVAGTTDGSVWATDDSEKFHLLLSGLTNVMTLTPAGGSPHQV